MHMLRIQLWEKLFGMALGRGGGRVVNAGYHSWWSRDLRFQMFFQGRGLMVRASRLEFSVQAG